MLFHIPEFVDFIVNNDKYKDAYQNIIKSVPAK
jgi:hypothetical protein